MRCWDKEEDIDELAFLEAVEVAVLQKLFVCEIQDYWILAMLRGSLPQPKTPRSAPLLSNWNYEQHLDLAV